jgi:hypothetical protein
MKQYATPRWVNLAVGVWLAGSALFWPHTTAQLINATLVGCACAVAAAGGLRWPQARYANLGLALWLFVSTWVLPAETGTTLWNHLIVSLVMLVVALVPSRSELAYR